MQTRETNTDMRVSACVCGEWTLILSWNVPGSLSGQVTYILVLVLDGMVNELCLKALVPEESLISLQYHIKQRRV